VAASEHIGVDGPRSNTAQGTLLIVNADDLGHTVPINDATFALMDKGLVRSATLLANGAEFEDAVRRLKSYPDYSFGVHLNLTTLPPLRPTPGLAPILNEGGSMSRTRLANVRWTPSLYRAVFVELSAQVERCLDAGVAVSHFDSHHHVHTIPWLIPVLGSVSRRFGVRRMRGTINILSVESMESGRMMKKALYGLLMKAATGARTPEGMGSFIDFYARIEKQLSFDWRSIELMVHPGATSPQGLYEEVLLQRDWLSQLPFPARLGTYLEL
jgi:predicted glycoside hydrolase/deacetylase ChbG (UPF0249 family)